jgi:L-alanine-DL-glutamate epimerase-like enolase superfamily enzyme
MKIAKIEPVRITMGDGKGWMPTSAFVRIEAEDGSYGLGEASPMSGGVASLDIVARDIAPFLSGKDVLDHAILVDTLFHRCIKLGPEGVTTAALAAIDIALWDLKGKLLGQPVYRLLGGAWRKEFPCYSSFGGNAHRTVDEVVREVAGRVEREKPAAVKMRMDGDRTRLDADIPGDLAKARAVRKLLGDDFMIGFDANNAYSIGGALRVGRELEQLGYAWFEEPVQHYHVQGMGEVAQRLSITVSAGEQTYTLQALKDLIEAGVRMIQPDIVKMGGITGMMQAAALAHAHGVELVPHQTQPAVGHLANIHVLSTLMHMTKPVELADVWERGSPVFRNPARPVDGMFILPDGLGLGIELNEAEWAARRI